MSPSPQRPASLRRPFTREQRSTIIYGMLAFVLILVILQLWLLTATLNTWLGGDDTIILLERLQHLLPGASFGALRSQQDEIEHHAQHDEHGQHGHEAVRRASCANNWPDPKIADVTAASVPPETRQPHHCGCQTLLDSLT